MNLARGTRVIRVSLYRKAGGEQELVGRVTRFPGKGGAYTVRLRSKAVRRQLKPGLYSLVVTPGATQRGLRADDEQVRNLRLIR
jgi:hypothetical protein